MASHSPGARPRSGARARELFDIYTCGVTAGEVHRLFTRDTADAISFFSRGIDEQNLVGLTGPRRLFARIKLVFAAFTMRLTPARRVLYGVALILAALGLLNQFAGLTVWGLPAGAFSIPILVPDWSRGVWLLLTAFVAVNLLLLLEVAERLSLKDELEVAREIQRAMLPGETFRSAGVEAHGQTQPANTVGGDFYDLLPLEDGRLLIAVGDVAGKGSPAALLMALLMAMLRTLLEERLALPELVERLNRQICRHSPSSRFITLFVGLYDPATGGLVFVNAGHIYPLIRRRQDGRYEPLSTGGVALGLFREATFEAGQVRLQPGDLLTLYSDGITEAESPSGVFFDEAGLRRVLDVAHELGADATCFRVIEAVRSHAGGGRLGDDLTVLALRRLGQGDDSLETKEVREGVPGV